MNGTFLSTEIDNASCKALFRHGVLEIDLWQSLSEGAEDFVADGAGGGGNVIGGNRQFAVTAHYDDLVAELHIRDIGDIYHALRACR